MLIAYPPPALSSAELTNATWAGSTAGSLTDGQPASRARLTTSGTPSITLTYASAFVPRVIPLLGLGAVVQAGDAVTATTGAGDALGGNSASQAVVQLPDGSLVCWIITGGAVSTSTVRITINRTGTLDIGEVAAMPGVDLGLRDGWHVALCHRVPCRYPVYWTKKSGKRAHVGGKIGGTKFLLSEINR